MTITARLRKIRRATSSASNPFLVPAAFVLSCVMSYAGAVNQGFSDIVMAVPFVVAMVIIGFRKGGWYRAVMLVVLAVCSSLQVIKHTQTPVFNPVTGETVTLSMPACLNTYEYMSYQERWLSPAPGGDCETGQVVEVGTVFVVHKTTVSSPDFSQTYGVELIPLGEAGPSVSVSHFLGMLERENGEALAEEDLRRAVFYYPSYLMTWPILPIIVLTSGL